MKQVTAVEGFPVLVDTGTPNYAEFEVTGGTKRVGYSTGYVFPPGNFTVKVTPGEDYAVTVSPYVPAGVVEVTAGMTQQQLVAQLRDGIDLKWKPNVVTTLDTVLKIRHRNVRFIRPRLRIAPPADRKSGIQVEAAGFRVEEAAVTTNATGTAKAPGYDMFLVRAGGSLAVRGGTFDNINTFLHVEGGHAGVVVEKPVITKLRAYALYVNGGDRGISFLGGSVTGVGNEPFFRCMEKDPVGHPTKNVYVGHVNIRRTATGNIGKDGITPRGVKRFAADTCVLENCQFRAGQDPAAAVPGKNPDPEDVLLYGCRITKAYAEHKKGHGLGKRILMIGNLFESPIWQPPIGLNKCTGAKVLDNRWKGGPPTWKVRQVVPLPDLIEANNTGF